MQHTTPSKRAQGFTLLELLIVIAIIAILATIIVIIINPVEVLKRARDVQRLSDLASTRTSIALYLTTADPKLDGISNALCKDANNNWTSNGRIFYSYPGAQGIITDTSLDGATIQGGTVTSANYAKVDGNGWIPVNLGALSGSSPLSNLPIDPVNKIGTLSSVRNIDQVYRYACRMSPLSFEINARLESELYTTTDNKHVNDGGNNNELYEIGTRLDILGADDNF